MYISRTYRLLNYQIENVKKLEYEEIVEVWEDSVRATHDFLNEEDIAYFKPLILNVYLDAVELRCIKNTQNKIIGFIGVAEQNLEMLFILSSERGNGIGKQLLEYSIEKLDVKKVDVNEANEQAVKFYEKCGFKTISRSELDSTENLIQCYIWNFSSILIYNVLIFLPKASYFLSSFY